MSLPFVAEPLSQLQKRYPKAIMIAWVLEVEKEDRPGLHRENVFDTEQGIRYIVSKDTNPATTTENIIHFSASFTQKFIDTNKPGEYSSQQILDMCVDGFCAISGRGKDECKLLHITKTGIPHYVLIDK